MPMYDIQRVERGVRYATYRVLAEDEEEALERVFEVNPDTEYFESNDGDTQIQEMPDCTCGICVTHGYPWACHDADPEDEVLDLGQRERAWDE